MCRDGQLLISGHCRCSILLSEALSDSFVCAFLKHSFSFCDNQLFRDRLGRTSCEIVYAAYLLFIIAVTFTELCLVLDPK